MKKKIEITRLSDFRDRATDEVAIETSLTIYVNEQRLPPLICSPGDLKHLTVGHLATEGLIAKLSDIASLEVNEERGIAVVRTAVPESASSTPHKSPRVMNDLILRKDDVDFLMCCLQSRSGLFKETGCAHASALGIGRRMIYFSEDLGRLNAIDKAIGHLLLDLGNPADKVLLTTGRVSSRMVLKVARVGIPVIASKAAPTDRAVELARESNVTLLGFLRENRVNVYTNEDRVV